MDRIGSWNKSIATRFSSTFHCVVSGQIRVLETACLKSLPVSVAAPFPIQTPFSEASTSS